MRDFLAADLPLTCISVAADRQGKEAHDDQSDSP